MNEPRVVESVTNECQSLGRAHESSSARAEQLIACLEGEIAKRDVELERLRAKTRTTMGVGSGDGQLFIHGDYESVKAAQRIIIERDRLRAELSAAKETISRYETTAENCDLLRGELAALKEQYLELAALSPSSPLTIAAPVSEAKSHGVVMLPSVTEVMNIVFDYQHNKNKNVTGTTNWAANIGMAVIDEIARLNAAPVQQVSVPDGLELIKRMQVCLSLDDTEWGLSAPEKYKLLGDIKSYVLAVPAAPAADAGLSLTEWTKDADEWGGALNYAAWEFTNECPEKSALLFNNTKGPLRAAIMKYAELVAAHRAKGVV